MNTLQRRWLVNVALLAVAAALALWLAFEPGKPPQPSPSKLDRFIPGEITRLRIEIPQRPAIELVKQGNSHWQLTAPLQAPAEDARVQTLAFLPQLSVEEPIPVAQRDLAPFGLASPKAVLMLNDTRLEFGDTNPLNHRRYVRLGENIFLLEDSHYPLMNAGVAGFVSRRLVPEGARIESIAWPKGKLLRAQQEGEWRFEPPLEGVSAERLRAAAGLWASESALWTVASPEPENPEKNPEKSSNAPLPRLEIRLQDQPPLVYEIVREEPELVLRRPDWRIDFHVAGHSAQTLLLK